MQQISDLEGDDFINHFDHVKQLCIEICDIFHKNPYQAKGLVYWIPNIEKKDIHYYPLSYDYKYMYIMRENEQLIKTYINQLKKDYNFYKSLKPSQDNINSDYASRFKIVRIYKYFVIYKSLYISKGILPGCDELFKNKIYILVNEELSKHISLNNSIYLLALYLKLFSRKSNGLRQYANLLRIMENDTELMSKLYKFSIISYRLCHESDLEFLEQYRLDRKEHIRQTGDIPKYKVVFPEKRNQYREKVKKYREVYENLENANKELLECVTRSQVLDEQFKKSIRKKLMKRITYRNPKLNYSEAEKQHVYTLLKDMKKSPLIKYKRNFRFEYSQGIEPGTGINNSSHITQFNSTN